MTRNPCWMLSALSADVLQVTHGFSSCFKARLYWIISSSHEWKLTAKTTVKICWRSTCCQSCVALLATRLCSSNTMYLHTRLVKQSSSFSRKHWILSLQVCGRQSRPKPSWLRNLGIDVGTRHDSATPPATWSTVSLTQLESISQNVIDEAVGQWRKRLGACMKVKRHHTFLLI